MLADDEHIVREWITLMPDHTNCLREGRSQRNQPVTAQTWED